MSATRDKTQKIAFVYSNLYQIYRNGKEAAQRADARVPSSADARVPSRAEVPAPKASLPADAAAPVAPAPSSHVLKTGDLQDPVFASVKVRAYSPVELIGKRVARPASISPVVAPQNPAIDSLKQNLQKLNELHSRLRFMLEELEGLVQE